VKNAVFWDVAPCRTCAYTYFHGNITCSVLFMEIVCINTEILSKSLQAISRTWSIRFLGTHLKGPYFWSQNIHFHRVPSKMDELLNTEYRSSSSHHSGASKTHIHACTYTYIHRDRQPFCSQLINALFTATLLVYFSFPVLPVAVSR
jgi:hypothetical protein